MPNKLFFIITIVALIIVAISPLESFANRKMLEEEIIRLHVVAHSDHPDDQVLKDRIRDEILKLLQHEMNTIKDVEEARTSLRQNRSRVAKIARQVIAEEGFDYSVKTVFDNTLFPTRMYGDQVYPAGEYEALIVIIGDGKGKNWWCVLFPTLCFPVAEMEKLPQSNEAAKDEECNEGTKFEGTKFKVGLKIWEWIAQKRL